MTTKKQQIPEVKIEDLPPIEQLLPPLSDLFSKRELATEYLPAVSEQLRQVANFIDKIHERHMHLVNTIRELTAPSKVPGRPTTFRF